MEAVAGAKSEDSPPMKALGDKQNVSGLLQTQRMSIQLLLGKVQRNVGKFCAIQARGTLGYHS